MCFVEGCFSWTRKVNVSHSSFYLNLWIGHSPFSKIFPRLFSISIKKKKKVRVREGNDWWWLFLWCMMLFEEKLLSLEEIMNLSLTPSLFSMEDLWPLRLNVENGFSSVSLSPVFYGMEMYTIKPIISPNFNI